MGAGPVEQLRTLLEAGDPSARLRAAMAAGTHPDPAFVEELVARCGVEPDLNVRETLTWALVRHPGPATVDRLVAELGSPTPRARSQALHTLSKIGDRRAWPAITTALLRDADDDVARTAWRTAAVLVPPGDEARLAGTLVTQLARGDREVQRSLTRALVALGPAAAPVLDRVTATAGPAVRRHAVATARVLADPTEDVDLALTVAAATRDDAPPDPQR
ncbi:HEAT repeat domain-containing protein [Rhodococcus aerolatus]